MPLQSHTRKKCSGHKPINKTRLAERKSTFWGGEAVPTFSPSFGPDEIAVFCGAELHWSSDSPTPIGLCHMYEIGNKLYHYT